MAIPLSYTEAGNQAHPMLFFIHGWPDSAALWTQLVAHFSSHYYCVCITLPLLDGKSGEKAADFPEIVERLADTITKLRQKAQPVVLVGHDWGAYLTYLLEQKHPDIATRLITLDVGAHFQPRSLGHALFMVGYQWWLIAAWMVGKVFPFLGNAMTRRFLKLARAPRKHTEVLSQMNYLYFYFWRARLFKKYQEALPRRYKPSKPMLYLYGKSKKYHFHSPRWEEIVSQSPGSEVVALKGYHWFMIKNPEQTCSVMQRWLGSVHGHGIGN